MKHYYAVIPVPAILLVFLLLFDNAQTYEVTGSVVNEKGEPQAHHRVLLLNGSNDQIASSETDSLGRFTMIYEARTTSSDPGSSTDIPSTFRLGSAYPNPFNPKAAIPLYMPENAHVEMTIFNILGQVVMSTGREVTKGSHEIVINLGAGLSQGQYLIRVQAAGEVQTTAMTYVSAGISSGSPGITVRPGGHGKSFDNKSIHHSSQLYQSLEDPPRYRLIVEGNGHYAGKELEIPGMTDYDTGPVVLRERDPMLHISIEGKGSVGVKWVGSSEHVENPIFQLTANPEDRWLFERWEGDLESAENPVVLEINDEKQITAVFRFSGMVDVEGNEYRTVVIGEQEWTAENLRVTRFRNGSLIPDGTTYDDYDWYSPIPDGRTYDDYDWYSPNDYYWYSPAEHTIYPHEDIDGLNSEEEVVEAYGVLYNWHAVVDERGLCPVGWKVPSDEDWEQLTSNLNENHNNIGNMLKSRLQADSPLGDPWNREEHPRWDADSLQYGTDDVEFSALPGGYRRFDGVFLNAGHRGYWWSSTMIDYRRAWERILDSSFGHVHRGDSNKTNAFSVRCVRETTEVE